ncbi:hypothetical protein BU24DRAFT_42049 [Aaosphaeria arxii CBS 175.79]|uniref:DUF3431 domain-containing protein n=1 Tax=Aaosphaeria arxii CBS 175.79 TaxID=1450172 RepID=A0A6A5YAP3_9PLEO|nr:uncharacterized protein BU24DRAFT_42049 [Aaosphaeria arxii CBS 175.79]KAF2022293.1 hypothetical protein BU24DRAFT_42049 [Aaosphaeria arxii CBS 175.79]
MSKRKLLPFLALTVTLFFVFLYYSTSVRDTWHGLPQHVGLGDHFGEGQADDNSTTPNLKDPDYVNWNPKPKFTKGSARPAGDNFTSVLVIAKTKDEDISWMENEIPDQPKAIYVADDPTAPLHPPKNKGHEVMVYLSYIIDHYDDLPDVSIFMHAHQFTWHNDDILGNNAAQMITRLSRPRVWREGFVNMRCSWHPGCPDWMHPGETKENVYKQEETLLAKSWSELFPLDEIPKVLAQPCCAQFALSRERIQAMPHSQYVWYRNWLFNTPLPDFLSGRIWEYVWQFVFTGQNIVCPKEHMCFCDQYGSCFGGEDEFKVFIDRKNELGGREAELRDWEEKGKAIKEAQDEGRFDEAAQLEKPEPGKDQTLKKEIERLRPIVNKLKDEAYERGKDPKNRAKEAGREWHEGDGY